MTPCETLQHVGQTPQSVSVQTPQDTAVFAGSHESAPRFCAHSVSRPHGRPTVFPGSKCHGPRQDVATTRRNCSTVDAHAGPRVVADKQGAPCDCIGAKMPKPQLRRVGAALAPLAAHAFGAEGHRTTAQGVGFSGAHSAGTRDVLVSLGPRSWLCLPAVLRPRVGTGSGA